MLSVAKTCRPVLVLALLALSLPVMATSTTRNVPADYATIQDAVAGANSGDTILVAPGAYSGSNIDTAGKNLTIEAAGRPDVTVIGNVTSSSIIVQRGETVTIRGFKFSGGMSDNGGGAIRVIGSTVNIENCIFEHDGSDQGAAIYANSNEDNHQPSTLNVTDTIIRQCGGRTSMSFGGAIWVNNSNLTTNRCDFVGNGTGEGGGALYIGHDDAAISSLTVLQESCNFINNYTDNWDGGAIDLEGCEFPIDYHLYNCSFFDNTPSAITDCGAIAFGQETNDIQNCIFWDELGNREASVNNPPLESNPFSYCDIEDDNYAGSQHNINIYPLFHDPGYDLSVPLSSPCWAAGNSAVLPPTDRNNFPWPLTAPIGSYSHDYYVVAASATADAPTDVSATIKAYNALGNLQTDYNGSVSMVDTRTYQSLIYPISIVNGIGTCEFTDTLGSSVTAVDMASESMFGSGAITVTAGPLDHYVVTGPSTASAGVEKSVTVKAYDASGNMLTDFAGTVHLTSSDGAATLSDATLSSGTGTGNVRFFTAGSQTVSASYTEPAISQGIRPNGAPAITGTSNSIEVDAVAATHLSVSVPSTAMAGSQFNATIKALDPYGNTDTNYGGTVHLLTTSPGATVAPDATLTSGVGTFPATLTSAGKWTVIATDTVTPSIKGTSNNVIVTAASVNQLAVSLENVGPSVITAHTPSSATAGTPFFFRVTARDAYGNPVLGYTGTVHFTSDDALASLPADTTLIGGSGRFLATLVSVGSMHVVATDFIDSSVTGSLPIQVHANTTTRFAVSAPGSTVAGSPISVMVTALDQFNNTAIGYNGTVHLSSSDPQAIVPSTITLTNGVGTAQVTLKTAGNQRVQANDAQNAGIQGLSGNVAVTAASANSVTIVAPSKVTAGVAFNFTVTAVDAYGNVDIGFSHTLEIVPHSGGEWGMNDPSPLLLTNGLATFSMTIFRAHTNSFIEVLDESEVNSPSLGTSNLFTVLPGAPAALTVTPASAGAQVGQPIAFTVQAVDAEGFVTTGYAGIVHLSATDGAAEIASPVTLTSGSGTFTAIFHTPGTQTITATDNDLSISGTSALIQVQRLESVFFTVAAPSTATVGSGFNVTVTARLGSGAVATGYRGTVRLSIDGPGYVSPNSTLTNGVGTFSIAFYKPGSHAITAVDTVLGDAMQGASNAITVSSSSVAKFLVYAPANAVAGSSFNTAVVAVDRYSNQVTDYNGTIKFWSNCPSASLPSTMALVNGRLDTTSTMNTAGSFKISVADVGNASTTGTSSTIAVAPGGVDHFNVVIPSTATSRNPFNVTVQAIDSQGNLTTNEPHLIHFTSSDGSAIVPGDMAMNNGSLQVSTTLITGGVQTITATDASVGSVNGTSNSTTVAAPVALRLTAASIGTVGVAVNVTVTAVDQYGHTATNYVGTVQFGAPDTSATLPSSCALVHGVGMFPVIFNTMGTKKVSAWDTVNSSIHGTTGTINVLSPVTHLLVTAPSAATHGNAFQVTVKAMDQFGVIVTNYTGTVKFTCTDTHAVLPANAPLTNGSGTFNVTMNSVGGRKITVYEVGNSSIKGTSSTITVN